MRGFRKQILWAFAALTFFGTANGAGAQTQPSGAATNADTQSSTPLPEVTALIRQAILQQRFAESKEQEYVFREDTNDIRLRKECTWAPKCPAPFGVPGDLATRV